MKKLPLKEYKKRCAELWDWLADNPGKKKQDWSSWKINGGKYSARNGCFACEHINMNCKKCFLLNLWFNNKIPKNFNFKFYTPCEYGRNSPYKLYLRWCEKCTDIKQVNEKCSFYARKIADYCKKH